MECRKLTAKLRDAVPVCFMVNDREVKRYKNIEMNQGQLIFAVEGFRYLAGGRIDWSEAVIGEIRARGIIDTNQ